MSFAEKRGELLTCAAVYATARGVTIPSIPWSSALFARFGGPAPADLSPRVRLPGMSRLPSAEDGDVNMSLNVYRTSGC